MRCRKARRILLAALDGEVTVAEREALSTHLGGCDTCRTAAEATTRLHRALEALPRAAEVPTGLEERALRRVRAVLAEETESRREGGASHLWWWLSAPLAAAMAAFALWRLLAGGVVPPATQVVASRPVVAPEPSVAAPAPAGHVESVAKQSDAKRGAPQDTLAPPPQVTASLDLFLDMPILENMEKLENFDVIRTVEVNDDGGEDGRG